MKYTFAILALVSVLSNTANAALNIVTTTQDLAAIANSIGAQHVEIYSLTKGTRDPHFAEAKPSMIRKVHAADILMLVGADLEVGWLPAVLRTARNREVQVGGKGYLDLSQYVSILGVPTGTIDRSMGDVHARGNPHYWLQPDNALHIARAIASKLTELDAKHRTEYAKNLADFEQQLHTKIALWKEQLKYLKGEQVISYHTSLLYLANTFDFDIAREIEPKPGIAPSPSHLAELVSFIKNKKIKWLIMEPFYETRSADFLRRQTGINIVVVPQSVGSLPTIESYTDLFDSIVAAFNKAKK